MGALDKIQIRVTALGRKIVLARFGKDPHVALDQRNAEHDFWNALIDYAFDQRMPEVGEGVKIDIGETHRFEVVVKRIPLEDPTEGGDHV